MVGISSAFIYHFAHPTAFQRALDQEKVVEQLPEPETWRGTEQAGKDQGTGPLPVLMGVNKAVKWSSEKGALKCWEGEVVSSNSDED